MQLVVSNTVAFGNCSNIDLAHSPEMMFEIIICNFHQTVKVEMYQVWDFSKNVT